MDELDDVKTIEDCFDMAIADANGKDEEVSGWVGCLDDVFYEIKKVKVFDEEIDFKGFEEAGCHAVVAVCEKKKKKVRITLDSLELIGPTDAQKLWLAAYLKWAKQ